MNQIWEKERLIFPSPILTQQGGKSVKRMCVLLLAVLLFCISAAQAESVWIEEEWSHIQQEYDCDGLPLSIDAQVLEVPEGTTVREYHMERLSKSFLVSKGKQIDWASLNCDTSHGTWRMPDDTFGTYAFTSKGRVYPAGSINTLCNLFVAAFSPEYIYNSDIGWTDHIENISVPGLTEEQFKRAIEPVALACEYQLGNISCIRLGGDKEKVRESILETNKRSTKEYRLDPEKASDYLFIEAYYPVYYQGLRLYSGAYTSTSGNIEIPNMNLQIAETAGYGTAMIDSIILDTATLAPTTESQAPICVDEAVECIVNRYTNMFMPGIKRVIIHQMMLEYVPMTGDVSASNGFSLYPAWVVKYTLEQESGEQITTYQAYHAVTGQPLF